MLCFTVFDICIPKVCISLFINREHANSSLPQFRNYIDPGVLSVKINGYEFSCSQHLCACLHNLYHVSYFLEDKCEYIESSSDFFQGSSFRLLKLENLQDSLIVLYFHHNRSSNMNCFIYALHKGGDFLVSRLRRSISRLQLRRSLVL